ncbi:FtsK/SpoIIIE domain-containing protein [Pseudofrankia inefficax]|uniref:FtsK/SpoIIIE domain-containing protein n=1 Tax=Pseudofrankia inefficax (strain DSM 45817 / CECT 9037 / DDB 130130 / EuI1c) TaxID=298654 RepID=UPI001E619887|nr:FtsK/SpoIIIE domain-containing protein [Pseudofrankia inefficax]
MTVRHASTGASRDVEITAEPATTLASVLAALPLPAAGRPCYIGERLLDPTVTVGESPLLQGATVSIGAPGPRQRALAAGAVGALRVLDGPDVGVVAWLPPGRRTAARTGDADLVLHCEQASREHVEIEIDVLGRAAAVDVGSFNGTFLDGERLTEPAVLSAGSLLQVGSDRLEWVSLPAAGLITKPGGDGRLDFDRTFISPPAVHPAEIVLPTPPTRPPTSRLGAWLSALLPVAMGLVLAVVTHRTLVLLMCLLGPLGVIGTQMSDRRQRRLDRGRYEEATAGVARGLGTRIADEERTRRAQAPDLVEVTLAATGASRHLWPRNADSPDGLSLRLGVGTAAPSFVIRGERWAGFREPELRGVPLTVDLRAVGVLGIVGPAATAGSLARWLLIQLGTLRSPDDLRLVLITSNDGADLSWATWLPHTYDSEAGDLPCWVGNTASTRADRVRELRELISIRLAERRGNTNVRHEMDVVVLLDGALALRNLPGMKAVLRDGPEAGVYVLAVDRTAPNECRGTCVVDDHLALELTRGRGEPPVHGVAEGLDAEPAEELARAIAPMRDRLSLGGTAASLPTQVRLLDLVGIQRPSAGAVAELWAASPGPTTRVVLGADADGPVTIDLAAQGPHTMLGGATGAGKSILLQTLVTSLLLANAPDELNLVLIDFKGGGAFLPFENCPHVVALLRSTGETAADVFDQAAARRVLASVRAEVHRRERLLARYGGEIDEYWRARRTGRPMASLPRLALVFDEFARVLETSPDFLRELVNVAAKGRSLGMHLVLATQSLQGKLSAELKNNIDLRITLRQNEPADSIEVLGVPDAAAIPGRLRGRGLILFTKDETRAPRPFQSGYLGDPPPADGAPPARVRVVDWGALGLPRPEEKVDHGGAATDQTLTIRAIEEAAARADLPAPFRPLLPPLPADLTIADLAAAATTPAGATEIPVGLADEPAVQAQPPLVFDLAGTDRLLAAGGPQSGRTTLAAALITGMAARFRPDEAHVYVIERQPAGLDAYTALPHCGAVVSTAEPDRVRRLTAWLLGEVTTRLSTRAAPAGLGGAGARGGASGGGGGAAAGPGGGARWPWIVLIVDGWEYFENRADPNFVETTPLQELREVIAAGPPVGVHVILLGGHDLAGSRTAALFTRRLLLPFGKEELRRLHYPTGTPSPPDLPGRAVDAATGTHLQLVRSHLSAARLTEYVTQLRLGPAIDDARGPDRRSEPDRAGPARQVRMASHSESGPAANADSDRSPADLASATHRRAFVPPTAVAPLAFGLPRAFPSMPIRVRSDELPAPHPAPSPTWLPLGIGGKDVATVGLDLFGPGPHALLVSGPPGSGRTTAAATIVRGLRRLGVGTLVVAPPRSPLPALLGDDDPGIRLIRAGDVKDTQLREAAETFGDGRFAVIVDDCDHLTIEPTVVNFADARTLLEDAASPAAAGRQALILCGDATPILNGQRRSLLKVTNEIRTSGGLLLLTPTSPHTAREHNLRLEPDQLVPTPPGRGYLTIRGTATLIQLAT